MYSFFVIISLEVEQILHTDLDLDLGSGPEGLSKGQVEKLQRLFQKVYDKIQKMEI